MICANVPTTGIIETAFLKTLTEEQLRELQSELNQELGARYEIACAPYELDLEAEL